MKVFLLTERQVNLLLKNNFISESKKTNLLILNESDYNSLQEIINNLINGFPIRLFPYQNTDSEIYRFLMFLLNIKVLKSMGEFVLIPSKKIKDFKESSSLLRKHLLMLYRKFKSKNY